MSAGDGPGPQAVTLSFSDDPRAGWSRWIALGLFALIAAWFGGGMYLAPDGPGPEAAGREVAPVTVGVRRSEARPVAQVFVAQGQAAAERDAAIRAEVSGAVSEVLVEKGAHVAEGTVVARFDPRRREAELLRARAELDRAERDFRNALALLERGTGTVDRAAQARATLAAAEAGLAVAEQALADTDIRAPFAGRLEGLSVEAGEFVTAGAEVGRVVDSDPLTVTARIPQHAFGRIEAGQRAEVTLITGERLEGEVTFVGRNADPGTRTFALEVTLPNPDGALPAGVSAEVRIRTGEQLAHFVSPAVLALDADGALGLKTVGADEVAAFHPVSILRAEGDGVWVAGPPDAARIITLGQGFVRAGDRVDPRPDERDAPGGDAPR